MTVQVMLVFNVARVAARFVAKIRVTSAVNVMSDCIATKALNAFKPTTIGHRPTLWLLNKSITMACDRLFSK